MVTGDNIKQLITATGYDAEKGVYTMSYDNGNGKRNVYTLNEKQLAQAGREESVAQSSTHKTLLGLITYTLRAASADNGVTSAGESFKSKNRYGANSLGGGGVSNFLSESLISKTTAIAYVKNGTTLASAEIDKYGEYVGKVDTKTDQIMEKPINALTLTDIIALYEKNPKQQIMLSIDSANAKKITPSLQKKTITDSHGFMFLSADKKADTITVLNPWNATKPITLKASEIVFDRAIATQIPESV